MSGNRESSRVASTVQEPPSRTSTVETGVMLLESTPPTMYNREFLCKNKIENFVVSLVLFINTYFLLTHTWNMSPQTLTWLRLGSGDHWSGKLKLGWWNWSKLRLTPPGTPGIALVWCTPSDSSSTRCQRSLITVPDHAHPHHWPDAWIVYHEHFHYVKANALFSYTLKKKARRQHSLSTGHMDKIVK